MSDIDKTQQIIKPKIYDIIFINNLPYFVNSNIIHDEKCIPVGIVCNNKNILFENTTKTLNELLSFTGADIS